MYVRVCIHTHIFVYVHMLPSSVYPASMSIPGIHTLASKMPFSTKRNQESLEKWLIPRLGQGKYNMNWELPLVPERKQSKMMGKRYRSQLKRVPTGLIQDKFSIDIDHDNNRLNLLNKIGKHESILISITIYVDKSFKRNGTLYSFKIPLYKALKRKNSGAAWQTPSQSSNCCYHHQPWDTLKLVPRDGIQCEHSGVLWCFCQRSATRFQSRGNIRQNQTEKLSTK